MRADLRYPGPVRERLEARIRRLVRGDGILAAKLGYNPNSSSLGVDVTFLLFGVSAIAMLTPVFSLLLRRKPGAPP